MLSHIARTAIEHQDNVIYFSPVSAMEIATKVRIGKLEIARPLANAFAEQMMARSFVELPLSAAHAELAGSIPSATNDPWDRLLAAQARIEGLGFITNDGKMGDLGVRIFW